MRYPHRLLSWRRTICTSLVVLTFAAFSLATPQSEGEQPTPAPPQPTTQGSAPEQPSPTSAPPQSAPSEPVAKSDESAPAQADQAQPAPEKERDKDKEKAAQQEAAANADRAHSMKDSPAKAWFILKNAISERSTDKRATATRALALIPRSSQAVTLAEKGLDDERPEVRAAAAFALGEMQSRRSIPKLRRALNDKELPVVLAAANSLKTLRDPAAYRVYYAVLTGERKSGKGLLADQEKMLHDPKKIALLGIQEGMGFIPFGGVGFTAVKMLTKDDSSPVRAAAAKALAKDPDPKSAKALKDAALDKSWVVRVAALDAIAHRGDPALLNTAYGLLDDDKDAVRYTAAAAALRLSTISTHHRKQVAARK